MKAADIVDGVRRESGSSKEVDVDPSKMIIRTVSPTPPFFWTEPPTDIG